MALQTSLDHSIRAFLRIFQARHRFRGPRPRRVFLCLLLAVVAGVEAALQISVWLADETHRRRARLLSFAAAATSGIASTVNFRQANPNLSLPGTDKGPAVLLVGSRGLLGFQPLSVAMSNILPQHQIYSIAPQANDLCSYRKQVADLPIHEGTRLVLFVSAGVEVLETPPPSRWGPLRELQVVQHLASLVRRPVGTEGKGGTEATRRDPFAHHLAQLCVCARPASEEMQPIWRRFFADFDDLLDCLQKKGTQPLVVVVPCEYQVDGELRKVLMRRGGLRDKQIDLDLPQRRLAAYCKDRGVAHLDLLPHLGGTSAPSFELDGQRLTAAGASLVAQLTAPCLSEIETNLRIAGHSTGPSPRW